MKILFKPHSVRTAFIFIAEGEWLFFNAKWAIFHLHHGKCMLHWWDNDDARFVLDPTRFL